MTVTCLRSPSSAALDRRIFSARCAGVYERGAGGGSPEGAAGLISPPVHTSTITILVHSEPLRLDDLGFQILEGFIIELELPFERAIGDAASTLEHGNRLIHNLLEGHGRSLRALALPFPDCRFLQARCHLAKVLRVYQNHGRVAWQAVTSRPIAGSG